MLNKFLSYLCLITLLLNSSNLSGQTIKGKILDADTKEPLPFCNISCKSDNSGTITNKNGEFSIKAKIGSTLNISFIGYEPKEEIIKKKSLGSFYLTPSSIILGEVKIVKQEDPAVEIIKKSIKQKKYFKARGTTQDLITQNITQAYLSDPLHKFIGLNKSQLFITMSDSFADGVPFFITEDQFYNDSLIQNQTYGVGVDHKFFIDFINEQLNFTFDVHDDLISIMGRSIISPLSINAFSFYDFYLIDSAFVKDRYCYKIKIAKKRKKDVSFSGHIWIDTITSAVQKVEIELSGKYLNHLKEVMFMQEFNYMKEVRYESKNNIQFTISSSETPLPDSISILIKQNKTRFESYREKENGYTVIETESLRNDIDIIDSLNNDSHIKLINKLSKILISSYITLNKVDIGPIYNMHSSNKTEGQRISFLLKTNSNFHKNIMNSSYIGYGFIDKRLKYGTQLNFRPKTASSVEIRMSYLNDLQPIGDKYIYTSLFPNRFNPSESDAFTSMFARKADELMLYQIEGRLSFTKYWEYFEASIYYSYKLTEKNSSVLVMQDIYQPSIGINLKYSKSKLIINHFDKYNVPKFSAPHFYANLTYSNKERFSSSYNIIKAKFIVRQNVNTTFFGRTRYLADFGLYITEKETPFSMAEVHRGNESFVFNITKSSLMNPYEFVSDRYVAIYLDQHLNGRILNYIPFLNKLEIREVLIGNLIVGNIHNQTLKGNLPVFSTGLNYKKPYAEVGFGIENIFKFLRINAIWRLTYLSNENAIPFGVLGSVYLSL